MQRSGSRFRAGRDGAAPVSPRFRRLDAALVRGRCARLLLAASCAAGCLVGVSSAIAGSPVAYTAWVDNNGSNTVTPINTATNATGTSVSLTSPTAIAITPNGQTALIASWTGGTVTPVTLSTGAKGTPIAVGTNPTAIAITPDGTKAYVANYIGDGTGTVTEITLSDDATTTIPVGNGPGGIVITPNGATAYVANNYDGTVTPINTATNTAGTPITVGSGLNLSRTDAIAITPNGSTVYAGNYSSDDIVPITVATNTAGTPITGVTNPLAIAITPDGSTAYITEDGTPGHVVALTLATGSLGTPITVGNNPQGIAITPDQATAYIANYNNLGVSVVTPINLANNTAETAITVGDGPQSVAITPDQPPAASFTATPAPSDSTTSFDASASTVAYGSITDYHWNFGDGTTADTTTPTTTHTYATAGSYTVTLSETDTAGTSTSQLFDGQTMIRDGGPSAQTSQTLTINTAPQVTDQPAATTVTAPNQAAFTVACAGSPTPTLQWQASTDAGATWTDVLGETATAMTVPTTTASLSGSQYRAVCTNIAGTATSDAAKLTVAIAPPVLGVSFEVKPHGVVFARTTKHGPLVQLTGPLDLHVGSLIDARSGNVTLVMAMPAHRTQSASVWDGSFVVTQPQSKHGLTHITLAGASFAVCPAPPQAAHTSAASTSHKAAKPSHIVRQLWSKDDHGQFQTYGHNSVATVRGTEWLTQDRCDGTLTHVLHGIVTVRPRGKHQSITVTAGHSYLARP